MDLERHEALAAIDHTYDPVLAMLRRSFRRRLTDYVIRSWHHIDMTTIDNPATLRKRLRRSVKLYLLNDGYHGAWLLFVYGITKVIINILVERFCPVG